VDKVDGHAIVDVAATGPVAVAAAANGEGAGRALEGAEDLGDLFSILRLDDAGRLEAGAG
jgi:hypothetical protein